MTVTSQVTVTCQGELRRCTNPTAAAGTQVKADQAGSAIVTRGDITEGDGIPVNKACIHDSARGLLAGDVLQVVTAGGSHALLKAGTNGSFQWTYWMEAPGFARVEILRIFVPELPPLPALLSNPIYFDHGH